MCKSTAVLWLLLFATCLCCKPTYKHFEFLWKFTFAELHHSITRIIVSNKSIITITRQPGREFCGNTLLQVHVSIQHPRLGGWGRGCVVVRALDFRSEGRWFDAQSLPWCCYMYLRQDTLPHIVSLSTQVYKWVPATYCWGSPCNGIAPESSGQAPENRISSSRVALLGPSVTLSFFTPWHGYRAKTYLCAQPPHYRCTLQQWCCTWKCEMIYHIKPRVSFGLPSTMSSLLMFTGRT